MTSSSLTFHSKHEFSTAQLKMNCNVVIAMASLTFSPGESNPVANDVMDVCIIVNDRSRMSVLSRQNSSSK